jgi:2-iminobutanoate/2-iminopropanoate deaminase
MKTPGLQAIRTAGAPSPVGPYSQAIRTGNFLFLSGQIPLDPATGQLNTGPIEDQTRQCLKNLLAVLESEGLSFANVVKTTVFMTDLGLFPRMNDVYGAMLGEARPARSTVEVAALPKGTQIEIEAIAVYASGQGTGA